MSASLAAEDTSLDRTRRTQGDARQPTKLEQPGIFDEERERRILEAEQKKREELAAIRMERERLQAMEDAEREQKLEAVRQQLETGTEEEQEKALLASKRVIKFPPDVRAQMRERYTKWQAENAAPPEIEVTEHEGSGIHSMNEQRGEVEKLAKKPGVLGNRARRAFMQSGMLPPSMSEEERKTLADAALQRTREAFQRRTPAEPQAFDQAG